MYRSPLSRTMLVRGMLLKQVVEVVDLSTPLPRKLLNLFSMLIKDTIYFLHGQEFAYIFFNRELLAEGCGVVFCEKLKR